MVDILYHTTICWTKVNRARKPCNFATLQQNELKSNVTRFTCLIQTCLSTNQVVTGCENLLKSVEISSTFLQQNLFMLRILPVQGKPVLQEVTYFPCMVCLPRNFIQSKVSIHATCNDLICCKTGLMWVVKRATSLFNSFCRYVAE